MTFAGIVNWIDEGWQNPPIRIQSRPSSLAAMLPVCAVAVLTSAQLLPLVAIIPLIAICVGWVSLIAWRGFVAVHHSTEKGDREYDKRIKYNLSEEYHQSESASAARKRRKK